MLVECPSCGCRFKINGGAGRPKSEIIVQNILDILRETLSVNKTAKYFKCSRSTIYRKLNYIGIDPKSITGRKYTRRGTKLS